MSLVTFKVKVTDLDSVQEDPRITAALDGAVYSTIFVVDPNDKSHPAVVHDVILRTGYEGWKSNRFGQVSVFWRRDQASSHLAKKLVEGYSLFLVQIEDNA